LQPIESWSVDQALAAAHELRLGAEPIVTSLALREALGHALASPVVSGIDIPAHDNAAMDGYAWRFAKLPPEGLRCVASVAAGDASHDSRLGALECVRIMTGAALPAGCDIVSPFESCRVEGDRIHPLEAGRAGLNLRKRGEDVPRGSIAIAAGRRIGPAETALAAALGLDRLPVRTLLRVAVLSTGKELARPGRTSGDASAFDSNAPMIISLLLGLGLEPVDCGMVGDDAERLLAAVREAALTADVILTTGGTGAGDADHSRSLEQLGRLRSAHVSLKPGRPLALGQIELPGSPTVPLLCLPGNPVAALVAFLLFVRPVLLQWQGFIARPIDRFELQTTAAIAKRSGRTEVIRAQYDRSQGRLRAMPLAQQGSGMLRSLGDADCLIVLDEARGPVAAGESVEVWPMAGVLS
jgi:molybdopterin molybdotransferase